MHACKKVDSKDDAAGARLHGAAPPAVLHGDALRGRHTGVVVLRAQAALLLRTRVSLISKFGTKTLKWWCLCWSAGEQGPQATAASQVSHMHQA